MLAVSKFSIYFRNVCFLRCRLSSKAEELKYREINDQNKRILQSEIKHETVEMKIKSKRVDIKYNIFKDLCKVKNISTDGFHRTFQENWNAISKYLRELKHYLTDENNPPKC